MAQPCPNYGSPAWKELTEKLGEGSLPPIRQVKSMKMFIENSNSEILALSRLDPATHPPRKKEEALKTLSDRVIFIGTPDPVTGAPRHEYKDKAGNLLTSVSRKLDENPVLKYRGDDAGLAYSDSGTNVHSIFEKYIAGEKLENIKKFAQDNNLPEHLIYYATSFVENLRNTGIVLSEVNLVDPVYNIAGRADIIHLKHDGTVDLYDIKTAYRTPSKITGNKKIWDPLKDYEGYKAQRYSTQLEYYSQMIEKAIGHPVSNQFIIPIEIEFKENLPTNGISTIDTPDTENTISYGYQNRAREFANETFGIKKISPVLALPKIDDSSDLIGKMTGAIQNIRSDIQQQAEEFFLKGDSRVQTTKSGHKRFKTGPTTWSTFKNQTDHAAQVQEIVSFLSAQERNYRDISPSISNYIETGNDAFLSTRGQSFTKLRAVLDRYRDRGFTVHSLSDISGFEDKKNWILIRKDESFSDLLYIGNEDLSRPFTVTRNSGLFSRLAGSDKSLFGNLGFSSDEAKYTLGSSLKNTLADAKKVEGSMIAMKMVSANPTTKFDRILIHSIGASSSIPYSADLSQILPILKNLFKHPKGESFVPSTYKDLLKNESLFSPETYSQDFLKTYMDLLGDTLDFRDRNLKGAIQGYNDQKISMQEFQGVLLDRISDLTENSDGTQQNLEKRRALSEHLRQIRGISSLTLPIGKRFERWASMPQNIADPIIQDCVLEFRKALSRVRSQFWDDYKKDFNKSIETLFKSSQSLLNQFSDRLISQTTRYYEPLLARKSYKVLKVQNGKQTEESISLPSFDTLAEDSDDFNNRSEAEQSFIRKFNDTIQKGANLMGIEWERGRIPLLKSTFYNQFYKASNKQEGNYEGLLNKAFASLEESFSTGFEDNDLKPTSLQNRFENQAKLTKRWEMLGLTENDYVDLDKHNQYETNLEVIADTFMMEAIRVNEFNRANKLFDMADSIYEWNTSGLFDGRFGVNLEYSKVWKEAQIHMRNQGQGSLESKVVDNINKIASISMITPIGGIKGAIVGMSAFFQQQLSVFSTAMANSFGANSPNFGLGNWNKAFTIIMDPRNKEKIDLLLDQFRMFNMSMTDMTSGHLRYGNRSFFKLKYLYGILNAGDWFSRGQILVAQMLKHQNFDAYTVVDGKLVYDEDKDGRFNGATMDADKGRAYKEATINELKDEGIQLSNGRLTRAYAPHEAEYMKNLADSILGPFDRETRGLYSFYALGRFLGLFKTWLPARLNAMFDSKFTSQINGYREFVPKEGGGYIAKWSGREMEGIWETLKYIKWHVMKYKENPYRKLTPHQQSNIRVLGSHLAVITAVTIMATLAAGGEDDKDEEWRKDTASRLQKSLGDIIATYNVWALKQFLYTPIGVEFLDRTASQVINVLSSENIDSRKIDSLMKKIPGLNAYQDIKEYVDEDSSNLGQSNR